jgi:hypothetical protein
LLGSLAHALLEAYLQGALGTGARPPVGRVGAIAAGLLEQNGVARASSDLIRWVAALVTQWLA